MGGKRVEIPFQPNQCDKRSTVGSDDDDRISRLSDDILVYILSLLSLKESARTSLLSTRWRNLWKHTPSLNFDAESVLDKIEKNCSKPGLLKSERIKYVKWVNSVIQSHESLTLQEFRIHFKLNKSFRKAITRWLEFAFSRHVQRLELDLENGNTHFHYCIPDELLIRSCSTTSKLPPGSNSVHRTLVGFKSLRALSLKSVGVSNGAIELLLDNSPQLEQLIVDHLVKISKLEICGSSSPMLKDVEITDCHSLESVKLSLPRLTTLTFSHSKGLVLENVPMLVNVTAGSEDDAISMAHVFYVLSCCISQLQTLCLKLFYNVVFAVHGVENDELCELPQMPKLKKLVIDYWAKGYESLIKLAALVNASPYLEEFDLQYRWFKHPMEDREVKDAVRIPHHHLKVFKFCGYYGRASDGELLGYILENCVTLEKIIIDPQDKETARNSAKQKLAPQVAQHIDLVIL
ncbi:hypothetical protein ABFS83_04G032600 [Erythranthe nasuta]